MATERPAAVEPAATPRTWEGRIPVRHRYTPGVAGAAFLEALRDRGAFVGSRCAACGVTYVPARRFCPRCFDELGADAELGPLGTLVSVTTARVDADGAPLPEGVPVGLIRLDGADGVLLHFLVDTGGEPPPIGARVEAVLRPPARRTASILDVVGFRPAKGGRG